MRLIKNTIEARDGTGSATLYPEEPEDMWHAYNLIRPNDLLRAPAVRKVTATTSTGSTATKRQHTNLTIQVISTDFDPGASQLHVSGRVAAENDIVGLGKHHTLDLELHRNFSLEKDGGWDSVAIDILKDATDTSSRAEIWAVVMQEGLANICLVTEHQTILQQKVQTTITHKRDPSTYQKTKTKFFTTLRETLLRRMDLAQASAAKPLLLAGPMWLASEFLQHLKAHAQATSNKPLLSLLPSVIVTHSASGNIHDLNEVLASPAMKAKLKDTKYARETALMDKFFELSRKDQNKAWYGPREVEKAVEQGAVGRGGGVLLINNSLFRSNDLATRKRWVSLVDRVSQIEGGEVRKLSSLHESGKRLDALGGIAAILTHPLYDLDESDDEGEEDKKDVALAADAQGQRDMII